VASPKVTAITRLRFTPISPGRPSQGRRPDAAIDELKQPPQRSPAIGAEGEELYPGVWSLEEWSQRSRPSGARFAALIHSEACVGSTASLTTSSNCSARSRRLDRGRAGSP